MDKTTIEERIFFYRNMKGWSQSDLASEIGTITGRVLGKDVISQYENGKRKVPSELVPVLAEVFGISTDALFYKPDEIDSTVAYENFAGSVIAIQSESDKDKALKIATEALEKAKMAMEKLKIENDEYKRAAQAFKRSYLNSESLLDELRQQTNDLIDAKKGKEDLERYRDIV